MRSYFPDSNFFLEFRNPSDLPWHELEGLDTPNDFEVRLLVPSVVITEIERHKGRGNGRKARGARIWSSKFREALLNPPSHQVVLRDGNPRVILELPKPVRIDFKTLPDLDPDRPDHRIVAEYATLLREEIDIRVLSDDTLLIIAARSLVFDPILIPSTWRLAPENDERDSRIKELEQEVKSYKQNLPDLQLAFIDGQDSECDSLTAKMSVYRISKEDTEAVVNEIDAAFSRRIDVIETRFKTDPAVALGRTILQSPTKADFDEYRTVKYPGWINSVRAAIPDLVEKLNSRARELEIGLQIRNVGFASATNVRLIVTGVKGILLRNAPSERDEKAASELSLPALPELSYTRALEESLFWHGGYSEFDLADLVPPPQRDPNRFYPAHGRSTLPLGELEFVCDAVLHQDEPLGIPFRIVFRRGSDNDAALGLKVRLHATNLRRPVEKFLPIKKVDEGQDTVARLLKLKPANTKVRRLINS